MFNDVLPIRLRYLLGWVVVILLSGCFRPVPVETAPEETVPVVISETNEAELFFFEKRVTERIIAAVVTDEQIEGIRAKYTVEGRFTQNEQSEILALVEGIPGKQGSEAFWVVLQKVNQSWQVAGASEPVSAGFRLGSTEVDAPYWMPPQILDFDNDGIQEVFIPFHEEQGGWKWNSVHVYRFNGVKWCELDWSMIVDQDNIHVGVGDLAIPYRYTYQVKWTLEDRDNDQIDEILINEEVIYYGLNERLQTFDLQNVLGKREQERVFKWVEGVFEPDEGDSSFNDLDFTESGALFPWWNNVALPDMVFAEYPDGGLPRIHFTFQHNDERIVSVNKWKESFVFQVLGNRIYFPGGVMDREGLKEIHAPDLPGSLSVLASPDETRLAWLFVSELDRLNNNPVKTVNATLLVSNMVGDVSKVIWTVEQNDIPVRYALMGWSVDGRRIYVGQTADLDVLPWRNFSGLLAVDSESGEVTRIGEQVNRVDLRLSPNEAWLVQVEQLGQADDFGLNLIFESRTTGAVWKIDSLEHAIRVGNFSFSPSEQFVIWQEWLKTNLGEYAVIRGMDLEDGLPREIYLGVPGHGEATLQAGVIRGWIDEKRFVLVEEIGQGRANLISVENGKKVPLSPYSFLAVQE